MHDDYRELYSIFTRNCFTVNWWIGLHDNIWISGPPLSDGNYTNWGANSGGCTLSMDNDHWVQTNDCTLTHRFICEIP